MPRAARLAAVGLVAALAAGTARAQSANTAAAPSLSDAPTLATLSVVLGAGPVRCVASAPGTTLCEWQLSNRQAGWRVIAAGLGTDDRVRLLCELPEDGSRRAPDSCTAHVMRSDRDRWWVPVFESERAEKQAERRRAAIAALESARTLSELSRLVGGAPNECAPKSADEQVCTWRATSRNHGHALLATSIGAPLGKKVRIHCVLPTDGSARHWESCTVEVGA
jgi:hypothetical protein